MPRKLPRKADWHVAARGQWKSAERAALPETRAAAATPRRGARGPGGWRARALSQRQSRRGLGVRTAPGRGLLRR
eukprot:6880657-Pyramimonas_sp.AAC.1